MSRIPRGTTGLIAGKWYFEGREWTDDGRVPCADAALDTHAAEDRRVVALNEAARSAHSDAHKPEDSAA
jgi:hypothetical protein